MNITPGTIKAEADQRELKVLFALQAMRIAANLDNASVPSPTRRQAARQNGYSGPLTRNEAAKAHSRQTRRNLAK